MLTKPMRRALLIVAVAGPAIWAWSYLNATPSGGPSLQTSAAPVPVSGQQAAVSSLSLEAPLSEQVDRLLATHDPEKIMAAYRLLANCDVFNRRHDRVIAVEDVSNARSNRDSLPDYRGMTESEKQHDKVLCAPMTERMRQSRIDYLAIAAKAGVAGASVAFAEEGPFGDLTALTSRPDDLLVREWKATARAQLTRDAEAADPSALYFLWFQNVSGNGLYETPPALAFRYGVAMGEIYEDLHGTSEASDWFFGEKSNMMQSMVQEMGPEQRAAELAEARRIAEVARQRRQHVLDKT